MKKLIKLICVLLVFVIGAALIVPFLIPVETYKNEITSRVKEATGRDLVIAGAIKASLFPTIGISMEKVSFSNPKGYSTPNMAEIEKLHVDVALAPLLKRDVQVKSFLLEKPLIYLEVNAQGRPNWEVDVKAPEPKKAASLSLVSDAYAVETSQSFSIKNITLSGAEIKDGVLNYRDQQTKASQVLSDVDVKLDMTRLDAPLKVAGSAVWNKEKVKLDAKVATLEDILAGKEAEVIAGVSASPLNLTFNGKASDKAAAGRISIATPSLIKLAQWTGSPIDWKGRAPLKFETEGDMRCSISECALNKTVIKLDDITAEGTLKLGFGGNVPVIKADLAMREALDLNLYLPEDGKKAELPSGLVRPAYAESSKGWSTEPLDLSGLRAANADIGLTLPGLKYQKIILGQTVMDTKLSGGVMTIHIPSTELYSGKGNTTITLDGSGTPRIAGDLNLSGIQVEPFLKDAIDEERLSGTGNIQISAGGRGSNMQQLISALNGNGKIVFTDGAIKGINLAQMVRNVKTAFSGGDDNSQKTDFAELGGTFTITNGLVKNDDLAMKAPLLRLKGQGTIDLPQRYMNYRLVPEIVGSLKGQGGKEKEGLEVPVIIEGPLDNLRYRPDLEGALKDALKDPEKLKEQVKGLKETFKENKGDLKEIRKELKDPEKLKDLLQGFR